jgi:hypothetical protein
VVEAEGGASGARRQITIGGGGDGEVSVYGCWWRPIVAGHRGGRRRRMAARWCNEAAGASVTDGSQRFTNVKEDREEDVADRGHALSVAHDHEEDNKEDERSGHPKTVHCASSLIDQQTTHVVHLIS